MHVGKQRQTAAARVPNTAILSSVYRAACRDGRGKEKEPLHWRTGQSVSAHPSGGGRGRERGSKCSLSYSFDHTVGVSGVNRKKLCASSSETCGFVQYKPFEACLPREAFFLAGGRGLCVLSVEPFQR